MSASSRLVVAAVALSLILPGGSAAVAQTLPVDSIMILSPAASGPPDGWAACTGAAGTPDLRGRYLMGSLGPTGPGGAEETSEDGAHKGSASTKGGKMSLNTKGGTTVWKERGAHSHTVDPPHVPVGFLIKQTEEPGEDLMGMIAFWAASLTTLPPDWALADLTAGGPAILLRGRKSAGETAGGSAETGEAGTHTPAVTKGDSGNMALNYDTILGSTRFLEVGAHAHNYAPPSITLLTVARTTPGATVPAGLIVPWVGDAASIPPGWALLDGTAGRPNLENRLVMAVADDAQALKIGGDTTTTEAGTHRAEIEAKDGKMALNPSMGSSKFNDVGAHTHTVDDGPSHYKVLFLVKLP